MVLKSLRYQAMRTRQETIAEAHSKTFEWILQDNQRSQHLRVNFKEWLQSQNDVYWISERAGSGKSTLMKYLSNNSRTVEILQTWVGNGKLITASFYFRNAGSSMQKSQQGLLQSLLHKILSECRDLIPRVCPSRWQTEHPFASEYEPWSRMELFAALDMIKRNLSVTKYCFFVDGLDEFDGDQTEIITILKGLATSPNIKICLSSRF